MINLLPPDVKSDIKYARNNVSIIQYTVLAIFAFLAIIGIIGYGVYVMNNEQKSLEKSIDTKNNSLNDYIQIEKEAKELSTDIDTAGKIMAREVRFSEVLKLLGSILPEGASLRSLQLTNDDLPVRLTTFINDKSLAPTLINNIEESDLFDAADLESINIIESDGAVVGYEAIIVARPASTNIQEIVNKANKTTENGGN